MSTQQKMLILGSIVLVLSVVGLVRTTIQNNNLDNWIASARQELRDEQNQRTILQERLDYISSITYHEKKAKSTLNLKEKGEQVIVVQGIDEVKKKREQEETKPTPTPHHPTWYQWYDLFTSEERPDITF